MWHMKENVWIVSCCSLKQLCNHRFKMAAGCWWQPALWPPLPATFHPLASNRKKCYPIPWSAKSTSLERHSKRFISESNAVMKHLHTYQKWIGWRFKSFLNKLNNKLQNVNNYCLDFCKSSLGSSDICRPSFFFPAEYHTWSTTRLLTK